MSTRGTDIVMILVLIILAPGAIFGLIRSYKELQYMRLQAELRARLAALRSKDGER